MLEDYLQIESLSIVFLGDFNPVILQPFWLSSKGLIREDEAITAEVKIIHNEIVKFELDWVSVEISKQRCEFKTNKSPYFEILKDLSLGVFKILRETPIKSLGINHIFDLALRSQESYYQFGDKLAPLQNWTDILNDPRLLILEILEENRKDGYKGRYRVRVTPSDHNKPFGISVNINDHFKLEDHEKGTDMEMVKVLETNWENSLKRSKSVTQSLLNKILK